MQRFESRYDHFLDTADPGKSSWNPRDSLVSIDLKNPDRPKNNSDLHDAIDTQLLDAAESLGSSPFMPLHRIVETLDEVVFAGHNLLPRESAKRIMLDGIADRLVQNFVQSYAGDPAPIQNFFHLRLQKFKGELRDFIARYDRFYDEQSLSKFLESKKRLYPDINIHQLFDDEMQEFLIQQINRAAEKIISERFDGMFEKEEMDYVDEEDLGPGRWAGETAPDKIRKEKRQNFILGYIFSRAITLDEKGKAKIDRESLRKLVEFLDAHRYPLECLYMLVYAELKKWGEVRTLREKTHREVSAETPEALGGAEVEVPPADFAFDIFLSKFDRFFAMHFTPLIQEVRSKKLRPDKLHLVDVTNISPIGMAKSLLPEREVNPIRERADMVRESEKKYLAVIRRYFNYEHLPGASVKDAEVKSEIADQLGKAAAQIKYTIDSALRNYDKNDPIHHEFRFLPEIKDCRDLKALLIWLSDAKAFKDEYPQHRKVPNKIILHQVRKMIELLLFYRKHAFKDSYKRSKKHRDDMEFQLKGALGIEDAEIEPVTVHFRIGLVVDPSTGKPRGKIPEYKVFREPEHELMHKDVDREVFYSEGGKTYRVFPVEEKIFLKVKAHIPLVEKPNDNGESPTMEAELLWYGGDGHMLHCKEIESLLSKVLRNYNDPKEPKDDVRGAVAVSTKEVYEAFKAFLYEDYSSGDTDIEIEDKGEFRYINVNGAREKNRSEGSGIFSKMQEYSGKNYGTLAQRTEGGKLDYSHVNFELQVGSLDAMLINISEYTVSSHSHRYTPQREFKNLFRYFFPPVLYGKKFAEYKLRGSHNA